MANQSNVMDKNSKEYKAYVEEYNVQITAQINELSQKREAYERVGNNASSIAVELESIAVSALSMSNTLENIVISGKSFDDGNIKIIGANISNMGSTFTNIASVCKAKINEIDSQIATLKTQYL